MFLNLETPSQQGHVGGVAIVDPETAPDGWGFDSLQEVVEERLHLLPPFRQRLVGVPFDVDFPYWVDDPHFDLSFHLRHIAVPPPGGPEELSTLVGRIHERPLDRSRPLWEMYLIEGLSGGLAATYTKLHHAAIDGRSGSEILTILLDDDAHGRVVPPPEVDWAGEKVPGPVTMFARSSVNLALSPARALRVGYEFLRSVPALKPFVAFPALVGLGGNRDEFLSRPTLIAPHSPLNDPITPHRRFAYCDIPLDRVKSIKNAAGTTVNDVVIAIVSGAVRRWMSKNHEMPSRSLQALIPISIHTEEDRSEIGNKVSGMIAPIGTHIEDSVERLEFVHRTLDVAKSTHNAVPATILQDFAQFAPQAIAARATQFAFRNGRAGRWTPFNLVISNIPGPRFPLYLAGARLVGHYPVSTITDGAALNVTVLSYQDKLCFGVVSDRDLMSDIWDLMEFVRMETDELAEALL